MAGGGFYDVLGVSPDATADQIRRAFRQIARDCHPDVAGSDARKAERFREARQAYEVLSDPSRRAEHDRALRPGRPGGGDRSAFFRAFYRRARDGSDEATRDEAFRDFGFGGREVSRAPPPGDAPRRGDDVHVDVEVPRSVAQHGGTVPVRYMRLRRAGDWTPSDRSPGVEPVQEATEVDVPPGVRHLSVRRVAGMGDAGAHGGPYGNLVARFHVVDDGPAPGAEAHTVDISIPEAALGARVQVHTPAGRVRLSVPAGTSSGTRFRLRGKGAPPDEPRRDFVVEVRIVAPHDLTDEARTLMEQLARLIPSPRRD